ncbi:hypothetical protein [Bradyrhizobium sp. USDA 4369]
MQRTLVTAASLNRLCGLEDCVINDRQVRRVDAAMLVFAVGASHASSGRRILDHSYLVSDDAARIELVDQHAMAARGIAIDRRRVPIPAARWFDTIVVETCGDLARRLALDKLAEDPPHDLGFSLFDLELAWFACDRTLAIRTTSGVPAVAYHTLKAPAGVDG